MEKIREDEMWCPECGAPIKKGFLTCSNCRLKIRMTEEINRKQDKKPGPVENNKNDDRTIGRPSVSPDPEKTG